MQGMIEVKEYTSGADIIAEGYARRKMLMGTPQREPSRPEPAPLPKPSLKRFSRNMQGRWYEVPREEKQEILVRYFQEGDTYASLTERVTANTEYVVTVGSIAGMRSRVKTGAFADLKFIKRNDGNAARKARAKEKARLAKEEASAAPVVEQQRIKYSADAAEHIEEIIKTMCAYYGIHQALIKGKCMRRKTSFPRYKMMWVAYAATGTSCAEIARQFGGFDRSTVVYGIERMERLLAANDPRVEELRGWLSDD